MTSSALRTFLPFVIIVATWWFVYELGGLPPQLLPSPMAVSREFVSQLLTESFWSGLTVSIGRVFVGFLLSAVIAVPVGLLMARSRAFNATYAPLNNYIRYLPVAALVPLMILWLGIGFANKVAVIFIGTFFQLTVMLYDNFRQVPPGFVEAARWLGSRNALDQTWRVILPYRLPYVFDDLKVALGWAWSYLLVAEIVAANSGIGFEIIQAQRFLQTQKLMTLIFVVGIVGLLFDWIFDRINRAVFRWRLLEDHQ
jgi:NitT/TauT family transport system permease protein